MDHNKDDYKILANTFIPMFDEMINELTNKKSFFDFDSDGKPAFKSHSSVAAGTNIIMCSQQKIKLKCYLLSDYEFYSEVIGKVNCAGHWCLYCDANRTMCESNTEGNLWTNATIKATLKRNSADPTVNKGVICANLLPSVEPADYFFPVLHQLLGTGNDIQKRIHQISDNIFEQWNETLIRIWDQLVNAETAAAEITETNEQNKQVISEIVGTLNTSLAQILNSESAFKIF